MLVAGDVMLDRYLFGGTSRISPEAPVPVVHVRSSDDRAGGAGNVAVNLAALGVRTSLLGIVGRDAEADLLKAILERQGIDCRFLQSDDRPTITKTRVQSRGQQLIRLDREEAAVAGPELSLSRLFASDLRDSDMVVLSDYGKGALADAAVVIAACRNAGVRVLVDPKGTDFDRYRGASVIKPNQAEFEAVVGPCRSDAELVELYQPCHQPGRILDKAGSRLLIATGDPSRALFIGAAPVGNRFGSLGAKWYCLNKIQIGETLDSKPFTG